jgi:hypothetical protein
MRRILLACLCLAALFFCHERLVRAQTYAQINGQGTFGSPIAPLRSPSAQNGVSVSDGVVLHAGVGAEAGYDTNVFYNDSQKVGAGVVRVTPFLELTNAARGGQPPTGLFFDVRGMLTYREYLSDADDVTTLRAFMPAASALLEHNSGGTLVLGVSDMYGRLEDAPYSRGTGPGTDVIVRDNNVASAQLRWAPGGGRLQALIRYSNYWDRFDTPGLTGASSLMHEGMLDLSWRWLPKTALFMQVRQGYLYYYNDDTTGVLTGMPGTKPSSYPLRITAGLRGLVTAKTAVQIFAGYQNAFYSSGPSTGGAGSITAGAEVMLMPLINTRITLGGRHEFQPSVIGNFYYVDGVYLSLSQLTTFNLSTQVFGRYEHRRFEGVAGSTEPRVDDFAQVGASLDYYLKEWAYAGVTYSLLLNRSDFSPAGGGMLGGLDYTKHQVFARLGFTY